MKKSKKRAIFIVILLTIVVLVIIFRYGLIMLLPNKAEYHPPIHPIKRGAILDRHGQILALSLSTDDLSAWLPSIPDKNKELYAKQLASFLPELSEQQILDKLNEPVSFVYIQRLLSIQQDEQLKNFLKHHPLPGIHLVPNYKRLYPQKFLLSHLLGFTGIDDVGLAGLEYSLNSILLPKDNNPLKRSNHQNWQGDNVYLSVDSQLQKRVAYLSQQYYKANKPNDLMVLVANATSGDILVYLSLPNFDPQHYQDYTALQRRNVIANSAYEPGSTFKIFSLSSMLDTGAISPETQFYDNGVYTHVLKNGTVIKIHSLHPYGLLNLKKILIFSSNVGTAYASDRIDSQTFYNKLRCFGFGQKVDLPLAGTSTGIFAPPSQWSARSKATIAFGQEIGVTALQVLQAATAFANNGSVIPLQLIKGIQTPTGEKIPIKSSVHARACLSPQTAHTILNDLTSVVDTPQGTARLSKVKGVSIAAKTGTSQVSDNHHSYSNTDYTASIIGFVPAEKPQFIIYIVFRHPRGSSIFGANIAAPLLKKIVYTIIDYYHIKTNQDNILTHPSSINIVPIVPLPLSDFTSGHMPNLIGYSKRALVNLFQVPHLTINLIGSGHVIYQSPKPGDTLKPGTQVVLGFSNQSDSSTLSRFHTHTLVSSALLNTTKVLSKTSKNPPSTSTKASTSTASQSKASAAKTSGSKLPSSIKAIKTHSEQANSSL